MKRSKFKYLFSFLVWAVVASIHGPAVAQGLSNEPIEVSADSIEVTDNGDQQVFAGDVVIIQGPITLQGDQITVSHRNEELQNLVIVGNPARLIDSGNNMRTASDGSSNYIIIDYTTNYAVLEGDVQFNTEKTKLRAQQVKYNLYNGNLRIAGASESGDHNDSSRLKVVITN